MVQRGTQVRVRGGGGSYTGEPATVIRSEAPFVVLFIDKDPSVTVLVLFDDVEFVEERHARARALGLEVV